jgi:hypothetical protein
MDRLGFHALPAIGDIAGIVHWINDHCEVIETAKFREACNVKNMPEKHSLNRRAGELGSIEEDVGRVIDASEFQPRVLSVAGGWQLEARVEPVSIKVAACSKNIGN